MVKLSFQGIEKTAEGRWAKNCPSCGKTKTYLRRNYAVRSFRLGKVCKGCSNRATENNHRGFYNLIRLSWFAKCRASAETRDIPFLLQIDDIWNLYVGQQGRCALSGTDIGWAKVGSNHTASIDRIDPLGAYSLGNVQLVHKDINMMKQSFTQERFIELCGMVSDRVKW